MADEAEPLYPILDKIKAKTLITLSSTINESSPLQIEEEKKAETEYRSVNINIQRHSKKYEREEKCLGRWLSCCFVLMTSIIPIAEIIMLVYYFDQYDNNNNKYCPFQTVWTYFILAKLVFEIVTVSLFAGFSFLNCGKDSLKTIGVVTFVWLLIWNIILSVQLFRYTKYDTNDIAKNCDLLIDFMLFESVSVWGVTCMLLCVGGWWYSHGFIIKIISTTAHIMHHLVITLTLNTLYQWCMSLVEIVFLAIYYDNYGACNALYGKYILAKLVFTVVIIACNNFILKCWTKEERDKVLTFVYIIGLIIWCIVTSIIFWGNTNNVHCRTNEYTSHYFDFILLDIILGFVVIGKVFCSVCWTQLSDYLGSPKIVEKYGQFAADHTAEWLTYKESPKK